MNFLVYTVGLRVFIHVIVFCLYSLPTSHLPLAKIVPFCLLSLPLSLSFSLCVCFKFRLYMWEKTRFAFLSLANFVLLDDPKFHSFSCKWRRWILHGWVKLNGVCVPFSLSTSLDECLGWFRYLGHCEYCRNKHECASICGLLTSVPSGRYHWVSG